VTALAAALLAASAPIPAAAAPTGTADGLPRISIQFVEPGGGSRHRPVFTPEELRSRLSSLLREPCEPAAIEEALARRYRFLGYVPTISASCQAGAVSVSIRESSHRIDLISFDPEDLARLGVSPDSGFEEKTKLYPVPPGPTRALLRGLLQTREGDLYNHERYRNDSEALNRLGYAIAFVPGRETGADRYPAAAYLVQSRTPRRQDGKGRRTEPNYLGGTASYGPRAGTAVGALYERNDLFGRLDRLSVAPTYNLGLGGDIGYAAPLLSAGDDPRRLYDLEVGLFSDFRNDRLLDGVETDERRTGVSFAIGIRPLRLPPPHSLRLSVGARHERVDLSEEIPGAVEERLTVLQIGATEEWRHNDRWPSLALRILPTLDWSLATGGGRRSFVRPGLEVDLHGRLPVGVEYDLRLVGGTIDRHVPASELWSLGGSTSVRGFREDSFLGRHLAVAQAEIWLPFARPLPYRPIAPGAPAAEPGEAPLEPRGIRLVKWALFVDGGTLTGTQDGRNPAILGAGIGLRFVVPRRPLVIRADYGWGLGEEGGDAFPYVSLGYRY
jgi:hypothetical protein